MDIGESHLIMAYAAVIGIHTIYLAWVVVKFRRSSRKLKQNPAP